MKTIYQMIFRVVALLIMATSFAFGQSESITITKGNDFAFICAGGSVQIEFTADGDFGADNKFMLYLKSVDDGTEEVVDSIAGQGNSASYSMNLLIRENIGSYDPPSSITGEYSYVIRSTNLSVEKEKDLNFNVLFIPHLVLTIEEDPNPIFCDGSSKVLKVSGAKDSSPVFDWWYEDADGNQTPILQAAQDTLVVTQGGKYFVEYALPTCQSISNKIELFIDTPPSASFYSDVTSCASPKLLVSNVTDYSELEWFMLDSDGNEQIIAGNSPQINVSRSGRYGLRAWSLERVCDPVVFTDTVEVIDLSTILIQTTTPELLQQCGVNIGAGEMITPVSLGLLLNEGMIPSDPSTEIVWYRKVGVLPDIGVDIEVARDVSSYTATEPGSYYLEYSQGGVCRGFLSREIEVSSSMVPTSSFVFDNGITGGCESGDVTLKATSTELELAVNGAPDYEYIWINEDLQDSVSTGSIADFQPSTGGSYRLLTINKGYCEHLSDAQNVTLYNLPDRIDALSAGCFLFDNVVYGVDESLSQIPAGATVTWYSMEGVVPDPSSDTVLPSLALPDLEAPFADLDGKSIYFEISIAENGIACSEISEVSVVSPNPNAFTEELRILSDHDGGDRLFFLCLNGNLKLRVDKPLPEYDYVWYRDGVDLEINAPEINVASDQAGLFTYAVSVVKGASSGNSCTMDVDPVEVTVKGDPVFLMVPNEPLILCEGGSVDVGVVSDPGLAIKWSYQGATTNFISIDQAGSYSVTLTDPTGCESSQEFMVYSAEEAVNAVPDAPIQICAGTSTQLAVQSLDPSAQYVWTLPDGERVMGSNVLMAEEVGQYDAEVFLKQGCSVIRSFTVEELPKTDWEVTLDGQLTDKIEKTGGSDLRLQGFGNGIFDWEIDGRSFTTQNGEVLLYEVDDDLIVNVQFTSMEEGACEESREFRVEVLSGNGGIVVSDVPNLITPNGDGFNDRWEIGRRELLDPDVEVVVMNRYGSPVFQTFNYDNSWDGSYESEQLPEGAYVYVFRDRSGKVLLNGSITILR